MELRTVSSPGAARLPAAEAGTWTTDKAGAPLDPLTIYFHGDLFDLDKAAKKGGWLQADPLSKWHNARYGLAAVAQKAVDGVFDLASKVAGHALKPPELPYIATMPMGNLYLDGKLQVREFEMNNVPFGGRDHFRVFATGQLDAQGRKIWGIAPTRDIRFYFDPHSPETFFTNHQVEADTSKERDFVMQTLQAGGGIQALDTKTEDFTPTKAEYVPDGKVYDIAAS